MKAAYHRAITIQALQVSFSPLALESVIRANLGQDALQFQFGHDHFHYDNNAFAAGDTYILEQRQIVAQMLWNDGPVWLARAAFGRLTHTAQDFYAHSNYVALWREQNPHADAAEIASLLPSVLKDPQLSSGRLYYPLELFSFIPLLKPVILPLLPHDSHAWMNKDDPSCPGFDEAFIAAVRRTAWELAQVESLLTSGQYQRFTHD